MSRAKQGTQIFSSVHHGVELQVRDEGPLRYLYLENDSIQSAMDLTNRAALPVAYTRFMAGALLLNPRPRRTLVIGLGGGGLVRFIQQCAPHCEIDAVDARADVIHVAQEYFDLRPSPTLRLWHRDGSEFVRERASTDMRYDMIFLDTFDHQGLAAPARDANVYAGCATLTQPRGVLLSNLWSSATQEFRYCRGLAERYFAGRVASIPVPQRGNVILYARHDQNAPSRAQLQARAAALHDASGVAFADVAHQFHAHQNSFWNRLGLPRFHRASA